jgi:hypothetical protein
VSRSFNSLECGGPAPLWPAAICSKPSAYEIAWFTMARKAREDLGMKSSAIDHTLDCDKLEAVIRP